MLLQRPACVHSSAARRWLPRCCPPLPRHTAAPPALLPAGKAGWIAGTTFLILVVPLIIEMDREQQVRPAGCCLPPAEGADCLQLGAACRQPRVLPAASWVLPPAEGAAAHWVLLLLLRLQRGCIRQAIGMCSAPAFQSTPPTLRPPMP
jgi:hypothetical protein